MHEVEHERGEGEGLVLPNSSLFLGYREEREEEGVIENESNFNLY